MKVLLNKDINFSSLTKSNNQEIGASLLSLEKVVIENIHFNIPIYQRLYVWTIDQIKTLLEDLKTAFINKEESYFLGGIMLSSSENGKIDLVDGQQRFTTLWLICDILSRNSPELKQFTHFNYEPRIHFSIRDKAQAYLKNQDSFKEYFKENGDIINGVEAEISEIIPLAVGRKIINEVIDEFKKSENFKVEEFGDFLYTKVLLSQTFIPMNSDMNRVFEAMNNRGKQLAHHELLKSKLLEKIPEDKRLTYSLMWDACSDMNNYIEKSIKDFADLTWKEIFPNHEILKEEERELLYNDSKYNLSDLDIVKLINKTKEEEDNKKCLLDILLYKNDNQYVAEKNDQIIENEYSSKKIRSIISFPTFLLHVLRIYHANNVEFGANHNSIDVNDKKLIEHFKGDLFFSNDKVKNENNVIGFIELLWKTRILFDCYIIKWVYDEENKEEYHDIQKLLISKNSRINKNGTPSEITSVQRVENTDETIKDLIILQGMLYHSQEMITQYWLTPFLHFLLKGEFNCNENVLVRLEILDNELFYSNYSDKLKDRTYNVIFKDKTEILNNLLNTKNYLEEAKGTDYPNYIFYKLEYVLWKNRKNLCEIHQLDINKWNKYRMTAKNSVEHIFPQNSKLENKHIEYLDNVLFEKYELEGKKPLDEFGNLVLISPGMNSEYSNKPYKEKKGKFDSKRDLDSLKSALIFKNNDWNYKLAVEHRDEMVKLIDNYINQTPL